eukprot:12894212-Prorocentrum_lima.AAC.1
MADQTLAKQCRTRHLCHRETIHHHTLRKCPPTTNNNSWRNNSWNVSSSTISSSHGNTYDAI